MSNEDKNISGSLILDLRKWLRHVQAKNWLKMKHYLKVLSMFDFSIVYKFIDTKTQLVFPDVFWGKADIYTQ